jgi:hypothetical protein
MPFDLATKSPQIISIVSKEISYLAIWDYREMIKDPSLKKASWMAMQQLKKI